MYQLKERKLLGFVPLFFPVALQSAWARSHQEPSLYDVDGSIIPLCSSVESHRWFSTVADKRVRCFYCRKYFDELNLEPLVLPELNLDLDSPVSATVNTLKPPVFTVASTPVLRESVPSSMDLHKVESYCLKCKIRTLVLNPEYVDQENRNGVRRFVKGSCSVCGSKINALVKRGDS